LKLKIRNIITILFILNFLSQSILAADSINVYFDRIFDSTKRITQLTKKAGQLEQKVTELDKKIEVLNKDNNLNWFEKWKLSRLMSKKKEMNDQILVLYSQIRDQKSKSQKQFRSLYPEIKRELDTAFAELKAVTDSSQRLGRMEKILMLNSKLEWLITNQQFFTTPQNPVQIEEDYLKGLMQKLDSDPASKEELVKLLENRVTKLDKMIYSAREAVKLRNRLNQFQDEMSAQSNESFVSAARDNATRKSELTYGPDIGEYGTWEKNIINAENDNVQLSDNLTKVDYLYIFQKYSSQELSSSIDDLDSLRTLYKKLLQDIAE